ncbi:delta-aminolevulinic acid dehydratase, partial [Verrucomicrobiota bacterium]
MSDRAAIDVRPYLARLREYVEANDYAGYDPYDALNSPAVRALTLGTKWGRIAWTQLFRRSPVNFRPLLGVPKGHNPKAIGLFLSGYSRLVEIEKNGEERGRLEGKIDYLLGLLDGLRSSGCSGHGWGYNFDWQSRAAFTPRGTPTVVNSAFIGHALLDAHEATGRQQALDLAVPIADFILGDLNRSSSSGPFCFSYTPLDTNFVHNANLLGASLLVRLHGHAGEESLRTAARSALDYSMQHQRDDGSWFYAEAPIQHWIDSFHTGFNLHAIRYFINADEAPQYKAAYEKGVEFYARSFFLEDGTPKYFHNRTYPIDIHCPAEAVVFFSGMGQECEGLTDNILAWMLANMWNEKRGNFIFRRGIHLVNTVSYMRWSQAWGFHALAEHLRSTGQGKDTDA